MKKIIYLFLFLPIFILSSCKKNNELILLNWQDYLSDDLITKFEDTYSCKVWQLTTTSNEQMYTDIITGKANYDVVIPSDYMIDRLYKENLLYNIYDNINIDSNIFVPDLYNLYKDFSYKEYFIPYFWGSLGIMYNKQKDYVENLVKNNGYAVFFDDNILDNYKDLKIGFYDSSRDAFAAAELYLGYDVNTTNEEELNNVENLILKQIKNNRYKSWGTDDLKRDIASGNLDIALVYSGDYFDAFYSDVESNTNRENNYNIYVPTTYNNVFFDGMVVPITSKNTELAYKFIEFMINDENSYINVDNVGYSPTLQSVKKQIYSDPEWDYITSNNAYNPALIINKEVYMYLGYEVTKKIEEKWNKIRYYN